MFDATQGSPGRCGGKWFTSSLAIKQHSTLVVSPNMEAQKQVLWYCSIKTNKNALNFFLPTDIILVKHSLNIFLSIWSTSRRTSRTICILLHVKQAPLGLTCCTTNHAAKHTCHLLLYSALHCTSLHCTELHCIDFTSLY